MATELRYKDITEKVIVIFQRALAWELQQAGLGYTREIEQDIIIKACRIPLVPGGQISLWKIKSWLN